MIFKKILFLLCFSILFSTISFGQYFVEKSFLDDNQDVIKDSTKASFITETIYFDSLMCKGIVKNYDKNYTLITINECEDVNKIHFSKRTQFYKNGKIKNISYNTLEGYDGVLQSYYENGKIKRDEVYKNGVKISGKYYSSIGLDTVLQPFKIATEYPGGNANLMNYLNENVKYPKRALDKGISGKVVVRFIVNEDGSLSDFKILKSVSPEIDKEALRVIRKMPRWNPGIIDGEKMKFSFLLPISFSIK